MLVAHEESGYEEWGASGSLRVNPSESGRRLSMSLTPVWGASGSATGRLWGMEHTRGLAEGREFDPRTRLEAGLGYGIGVPHARGVVTPYTGLSWAEQGDRTHRLGTRWKLSPDAAMGLEATHEPGTGDKQATRAICRGAAGRRGPVPRRDRVLSLRVRPVPRWRRLPCRSL